MRLQRRLFLAALIALVAAPSQASPPAPASGHGEETKDAEVARSIDLGGLAFPMFDEKGKLKNYLFVNARMLVAPGKDQWKYREKAHTIRDGIIRAAHRISFDLDGDYTKLDEALAAKECIKAANESIGEKDALVAMTFTQVASQGKVARK
ncbi:MAG TPA: hypothetical protein VFV70_15225 [Hyphomonadaceae bacterium]|nr:hypothetical protein [Hyphomonadaceae bacterium]